MKINVRLLLITFVVIVLISLTSTFIYHSITTTLLIKQHSQSLLNSTTDFKFAFQSKTILLEDEFDSFISTKSKSLDDYNLDFVFQLDESKKILPNSFLHSDKINSALLATSFDSFFSQYPNSILKFYKTDSGEIFFYGKIIDEEFLNSLSEKVRAEISLVVNNIPIVTTHLNINNRYFPNILTAIKSFKSNKIDKSFYEEVTAGDFFAEEYTPEELFSTNNKIQFVLFKVPHDLSEFKNTMQTFAITIALAGILLALIFVLLFTTKLRRQISLLNNAAKITAKGDLSHRVEIIAKDELGNLGAVFNNMLDKIEQNELMQRHYTELITILNETDSLKELCDNVLEKIVTTTNLSFGVFYVVENKNAKSIATYGVSNAIFESHDEEQFYSNVIEKQKTVEISFDENPPIIKTGLVEIRIHYLLVIPLVFNKNVIGVLELASEHKPKSNPSEYLNMIKEQVAVGLNSVLSYERLGNLVNELKFLNEDYQKQNLQISEQNSELIILHEELKRQAEELEEQRKKAVELTHVKSQFLASMSHELRTPLNSIIGLSELIVDDVATLPKTKERLKIILRNGKKLLSLINNILEFSKIEAGKFGVENSNFVISEFFMDIYNAMEPLVSEKGLEFTIYFTSDYDLLINTDKHKLEQILLNLLSNAIKFTEIGKIAIEIKIVDNISLQIDVIDSGVGISEDDKKIIFEEFEQSSFNKTKKYQGAGLGLAICKKYISLLNGEISVSTNKYKGSTFSIKLNKVILEKFILDANSIFTKANRTAIGKKRIIVFGKDEESNKNLNDELELLNYSVTIVNDLEKLFKVRNENVNGIIINATSIDRELIENIVAVKKSSNDVVKVVSKVNNKFCSFGFDDILVNVEDKNNLERIVSYTSVIYEKVTSILVLTKNDFSLTEIVDSDGNIVKIKAIPSVESISEIKKFNLVIVDSSFDVMEILSIKDEVSKIPLFFNIKRNDEETIRCFQQVFDYCSQKTFKLDELLSVVSKEISLLNKAMLSVSSLVELDTGVEEKSATVDELIEVLVVDDDKDTLFTVGEILQNIGCKVLFAENGAECLSVLKDATPELILLDIMMPVMDGFETIKQIRSNSKTQNLTVYALTAQAMLDDLAIIKNNGFDDLITKPVIASTLSFKIQQLIQKNK